MLDVVIREERSRDRDAVRAVNERAFGRAAEANLVEALHRQSAAVVALVAEAAEEIIGHILFSPVSADVSGEKRLVGLAPMAVLPRYQRKGVGGRLVGKGLERCEALGFAGVVVLGDPAYYLRFGFVPAANVGLRCEYGATPASFMIRELPGHSINGVHGLVRYHTAFGQL